MEAGMENQPTQEPGPLCRRHASLPGRPLPVPVRQCFPNRSILLDSWFSETPVTACQRTNPRGRLELPWHRGLDKWDMSGCL